MITLPWNLGQGSRHWPKVAREMRIGFALWRVTALVGAACLCASAPTPSAEAPQWITDTKGCKVRDDSPRDGEVVTWSGSCVNGVAEGTGELSDFVDGKWRFTIAGTRTAGALNGHEVIKFANRSRFEADYRDGKVVDHADVTLPYGDHAELKYVDPTNPGKVYFERGFAVYNVCITAKGDYESSTMMQSSGDTMLDRAVLRISRSIRLGPDIIGGRPADRCYTMGAAFSNDAQRPMTIRFLLAH